MRVSVQILAIAFLAAGPVQTALGQLPLTQVQGTRFHCSDAHLGPCMQTFERELVKSNSGIVRRAADGFLQAKLEDGRWISTGKDCPTCDYAMDLLQDRRYLAVLSFGEEDIYWKLLDRANGKITRIEGYPLFSPDGHRIAVGERDEMNTHALDIYSVTPTGLVREFQGILRQDNWAPQELCWIDNSTVAYERTISDAPYDKPGTPEILVLRDGKWRIERSSIRCAQIS